MTIQEAYIKLVYQLFELYDDRESANIADLVIEQVTGLRKIDRILYKKFPLSAEQQEQLNKYSEALLQHKPVQYVLNEAWFAGMKFYVDENVLIPRPETEELVEWIIEEVAGYQLPVTSLLDIGTGSGCIPIALKKKMPAAEVHAVDISEEALHVAKKNAGSLNTAITFYQLDILNDSAWTQLPAFDIIVSNPPYIKKTEASDMRQNVLQYEPHLALFVPDNDPLIFYKNIAKFGLHHLHDNGLLFFETNETHGREVVEMLEATGYTEVKIRKDLQGKERMVKANL